MDITRWPARTCALQHWKQIPAIWPLAGARGLIYRRKPGL